MSTYRVKTGHGAALVDLVVLDPQPRTIGAQATRRTHAASGLVYDEALFVRFEYDYSDDATAYLAILTAFGLASASQANVTIYARNQRYAWVRYNGVSVLPEVGRDVAWTNYFARGISIIVKDLVAL
jgi:hypothetical protein